MQLNDTDKMAMIVTDYLEEKLGDRIGTCAIFNVVDDKNNRAFSINFKAYNYFIVLFNYDKGRIGCSIQYGENNFIPLDNSQKWYEETDFEIFCKEFQQQIELRIPDKFLDYNGWK